MKKFSDVENFDNILKKANIVKDYPFYAFKFLSFFSFLSTIFPFSLFFKEKYSIESIGADTYLIREVDFEKAFSVVSKFYPPSKKKFIHWRGVYKEGIFGNEINLQRIGFKFFIDDNEEQGEILPIVEQNYAPIEINYYVTSAMRDDKASIKLLSIFNDDLMITKHMILHLAEKMGYSFLPEEKMDKIIKNPNTWIFLDDVKKNNSWRLFLRIVDMNCKVFLRLSNDDKKLSIPTVDEVVLRLEQRGIVYGVDKETIKRYLNSHSFDDECLAVHSLEPMEGLEEIIEEVAFHNMKRKNETTQEGGAFYVFSRFVTVKKGDLVLRRIPGKKAKDGIDVFGRVLEVEGVFGKKYSLKIGSELMFSKDGMEVIAKINGNLFCNHEGIWNIEKVLELDNVGPETGNISYIGSVVVNESVHDGFSLVATGNVRIGKSVGSSFIETGGNIDIIFGMNGKGKGKIISHFGSVVAKFILDSTVVAEKKVVVQELLGNCTVHAGSAVEALGLRSAIWGGSIYACLKVMATNIGSVMEKKTFVNVGHSQKVRLKLLKLKESLNELQSDYTKKLKESKAISRGNLEKVPFEMQKEISFLLRKIGELELRKKDLRIEKDLEEISCEVVSTNVLYGGVVVRCGKAELINKKYRKSVVLTANPSDAKMIKVEPYIFNKNKSGKK